MSRQLGHGVMDITIGLCSLACILIHLPDRIKWRPSFQAVIGPVDFIASRRLCGVSRFPDCEGLAKDHGDCSRLSWCRHWCRKLGPVCFETSTRKMLLQCDLWDARFSTKSVLLYCCYAYLQRWERKRRGDKCSSIAPSNLTAQNLMMLPFISLRTRLRSPSLTYAIIIACRRFLI